MLNCLKVASSYTRNPGEEEGRVILLNVEIEGEGEKGMRPWRRPFKAPFRHVSHFGGNL
jgi:hypothetical protein